MSKVTLTARHFNWAQCGIESVRAGWGIKQIRYKYYSTLASARRAVKRLEAQGEEAVIRFHSRLGR